jgi:hypothetical protein
LTIGQVVQYKEQENSVASSGEESSFVEKSVGKPLKELLEKAHKFSIKDEQIPL